MLKPLKALSLFLVGSIALAAAGCSGTGTTPGGDEPGGDKPIGPGQEEPPVTEVYEYGENWADAYDKSFTDGLLALGEQDFTLSQLSGTDALGRTLDTTVRKKDKYVGIFYFVWLNSGNYPYDISKLLEKYGAYNTEKNPLWALSGSPYYDASLSPMHAFHYFEEPFYGYYSSVDKWVVMRHLELLSYAGIDFLYIDFTNAGGNGANTPNNIYPEATYTLLDSILEMQALGFNVPKIVPVVCNPDTGGSNPTQSRSQVVEWVYNNYYNYQNGKYKSCWFTADKEHNPSGKPLLVSYTIDKKYFVNAAAYDAFWYRNVVWPTHPSRDLQNGFPWMDYSLPQDNYNGFMNVSIAQHLEGHWSSEAFLARQQEKYTYTYRGRSAMGSMKCAYESDDKELANYGNNFAEQWDNAVNAGDKVWLVTVTGWNEWVAQKFDQGCIDKNGNKYSTFVDTFDVAFSRDIEMMRDAGGYADNYYMQLAENVARFKAQTSERKSDTAMFMRQTVKFDEVSAWDGVQAKYVDISGGVQNRNAKSVGSVYTYTDNSARNDVEYVKIANDSEYLYVLAKTKTAVSAYESGDGCWMNLYLSTGARGGWESYNYLINRKPGGGTTSIEKLSADYTGKLVTEELTARADIHVEGEYISYRIPLKEIGVTSASEIGVKICDNLYANQATKANDGVCCFEFGDIMAFYGGGECAPIGRLNYTYRLGY